MSKDITPSCSRSGTVPDCSVQGHVPSKYQHCLFTNWYVTEDNTFFQDDYEDETKGKYNC